MPNNKAVIDIEVNDSAFQRFSASFAELKAQIASFNKKTGGAPTPSEAAATPQQKAKVKQREKEEDARLEKRKKMEEQLANVFKGVGSSMQGMAANGAKLAAALGGIPLGTLATLASVAAGMGVLASNASDRRREAQGLGIETGQLRAAEANFGKYINPNGTLQNISNIQSDLSRRPVLDRLSNGGAAGKNAAELLPELMANAVKQFNAGGKTEQYANAMGLTQVFTMEELKRLSSLSEQELSETIAQYKKDREQMQLSDNISKQWQEFMTGILRAGQKFEVAMLKILVPLAKPLEIAVDILGTLAEVVGEVVDVLDQSGLLDALAALAKVVGEVLRGFVSVVKDVLKSLTEMVKASGILGALEMLGRGIAAVFEIIQKAAGFFGKTITGEKEQPNAALGGQSATANDTVKFFESKGWSKAQAIGIAANIQAESAYKANAVGDNGKAYGLGQWHPDRQKKFEQLFNKDIRKSTAEEQMWFYDWELKHTEKKIGDRLGQSKTPEDAAKVVTYAERPANIQEQAYKRAQIAANINLNINNSTGGSAVTSAAAMGGTNAYAGGQ